MGDLVERLRQKEVEGCDHSVQHCKINDELEEAADEIERLREALQEIERWSKAYPRSVFIEPTKKQWAEANRVLDEAGGCSLTAISGSNMRHCVEGVGKIAAAALSNH